MSSLFSFGWGRRHTPGAATCSCTAPTSDLYEAQPRWTQLDKEEGEVILMSTATLELTLDTLPNMLPHVTRLKITLFGIDIIRANGEERTYPPSTRIPDKKEMSVVFRRPISQGGHDSSSSGMAHSMRKEAKPPEGLIKSELVGRLHFPGSPNTTSKLW